MALIKDITEKAIIAVDGIKGAWSSFMAPLGRDEADRIHEESKKAATIKLKPLAGQNVWFPGDPIPGQEGEDDDGLYFS